MAFVWALLLWGVATCLADGPDVDVPCAALPPPPAQLQVAWISPVRQRAWGHTALSVVRVAELRTLVQAEGADVARTLQALGLVGSRGKVRKRYKITMFDVNAEQVCRPVEHTPEGDDSDGLPACPGGRQKGVRWVSGCGTTWDTARDAPGLVLFRVSWREAARSGFCVMPLERFVAGA